MSEVSFKYFCMCQRKCTHQEQTCPHRIPQLECDKEVVIPLERLSDSAVTEMTAHRSTLHLKQELNDDTLGINSLPEEIILKIFGYLRQNQLGQIACVCRSWNVLTQSPVLWKEVDVKLYHYCGSQNTVATCFVKTLPSCVSRIRLDFRVCSDWTAPLNFEELSFILQKRCPHLKILTLECAKVSDCLPSVIDICTRFLEKLQTLVFRFTYFPLLIYLIQRNECDRISQIEILDLSRCDFSENNKPSFSKMAFLKQLYLRNANVDDSWFEDDTSFLNQLHVLDLGETEIGSEAFQAIHNHGLNLRELYLCGTDLEDDDFSNSVFPHLKTLCLRFCDYVSCEVVVSLIQSCQSLQNVYVDEEVAESYIVHPFAIANRCKLDIVKFIDWCNHEKTFM